MALPPGFRLGIYVFKDAEIADFAAPYGVFSVARRMDPALDAFLITESLRPVQAQGSWIYAQMGLLDGLPATNRKEPDRLEASSLGKNPNREDREVLSPKR